MGLLDSILGGEPKQVSGIQDTTVTGGGLFNPIFQKGSVNLGVSPFLRGGAGQMVDTARGLFRQLETNPFEIARSQYSIMEPLLAEAMNRDRFDMESRLFSQGRLGSTEGTRQFGELLGQQEDARRKLLFDALGQGLNTQRTMADIGLGLFSGAQQPDVNAANILSRIMGIYGPTQFSQGGGLGSSLMGGLVNAGLGAATGGLLGGFTPGPG